MKKHLFLGLVWAAALWLAGAAAAQPAREIARIDAVGWNGEPVDREAVMTFCSQKPGDAFEAAALARDVRTMQASGQYADVQVEAKETAQGLVLIYRVQEKTRIRAILVEGADKLGASKFRSLLGLQPEDWVDQTVLAGGIQRVQDEYRKRKFFDVQIQAELVPVPEDRKVDLHFLVRENLRLRIQHIRIEGNENISGRKLRRAMETGEWELYSWIFRGNVYGRDQIESDRLRIHDVYLNEGYLDARVGEPKIVRLREPDEVDLILPVTEGPQYRVGGLIFEGQTLYSNDVLRTAAQFKPGQVVGRQALDSSERAVRDYYESRGYIDTRVSAAPDAGGTGAVVNIRYRIQEAPLAHIRDIRVAGNTRTRDKVIRREVVVYPGDVFDGVRVRKSENRLKNLGFFSYAGSHRETTADLNLYDLVFDVEEGRAGNFSVGAGFSSVEDFVLNAELQLSNFDIARFPPIGGGQKLKLYSQFGTKVFDVDVSFVEPWFLNRQLSFGIDLFRLDRKYYSSEYNQRNIGGTLSLSKPIPWQSRATVSYTLQEVDIYDVSESASDLIKQQAGARNESLMGLSLLQDTRDSAFFPTTGWRTAVGTRWFGGPFGGQTDMYKLDLDTSVYIPIWFKHVINLKGLTAVAQPYGITDSVPLANRLFLGGPYNMRGFKFRSVGPADDKGEALGGSTSAYGGADYIIPFEWVAFSVYYDIGMVWADPYHYDGRLNSDFGIGLQFRLPVFPLWLGYAWPLQADPWNDSPSGRFNFNIGFM